jgi:type I restriction enzyme S subunit
MRKGWQIKALGELCEIELGKTPARANASYWDEKCETGNVWLSIADLLKAESNIIFDSKEYVSDKGAAICKLVPKGTLLVSFKLTLGRLAFAGRDLFTNEAIAALTIFNESEISKEFLFYCLTFFDWVKAAENDVKLKGMTLSKAKLKVMPVSFPPLSDQQRIVALLDEAFAGLATAKANAERNLQNARALFESHLQSVFSQRGEGWVEATLGEVCEMYQPKTIGLKDLVSDGQYPVFGANGIIGRYDKFNHEEPQLLITCRGATCGSVNISEPFSWITGNAMVVRPLGAALDLGYLVYAFRGGINTSEAITGSAQPQITRTNLSPLAISFPFSVEEQQRLAARFQSLAAEIQRLTHLYERKLAAMEELKKSLLHQAFNGEL